MNYSTLLSLLLTPPVADALLPWAQRLLPHLQQLVHLLHDFRRHPVTPAATQAFEQRLQERLRTLGLDLTDWTFNHREEDPQPQHRDADGERYRRRSPTPNTVAKLFGSVSLWRHLYEKVEPGTPCRFPLEQRLGIVAGAATPALAERASWWLAQQPQGRTLELLARDHGGTWSAATLRNGTGAFATGLEAQRQDAQVEQVRQWLQQAEPSRGRHRPTRVVGRDGLHLPRRSGASKAGATATLTVYDRRDRRLGTVYLGRMPQPGQGTLAQPLTALLEEVLRQGHGPVPRLGYGTADGPHPATYYRRVLAHLRHPRTGERLDGPRVVDFDHAAQYLQHLAEALFGDTKQGRKGARRRRRRLKEKDGVKRVLQAATYHRQTRGWKGCREEAFEKAYQYLRRNGKWMASWRYQRLGLPLGSGVTEAGCQTVFTPRLKQSGMRWDVAGGPVVVTLRVVLLSGVWDQAVARLLASQTISWPGVTHSTTRETSENAA